MGLFTKDSGETKKCRECLSEMPKQARKCAKCGSKQPSEVWKLVLVTFIIMMVFTIFSSFWDTDTPTVTNTYTPPPVQQSDFELGMYQVESEEFAYMSVKEVNLWKSYSDRTKIGSVSEGDIVEVIGHDPKNDYCRVKTVDYTGWMACGWLVK